MLRIAADYERLAEHAEQRARESNRQRWSRGLDLQKAHPRREMKAPWTDPALRELLALAALSAFGCGLALAHADFLFAAIFAAASAAVIVEALRRLR
jgi:hypothetical protein